MSPEATDFLYPFIEGDETDAEELQHTRQEEAVEEVLVAGPGANRP